MPLSHPVQTQPGAFSLGCVALMQAQVAMDGIQDDIESTLEPINESPSWRFENRRPRYYSEAEI